MYKRQVRRECDQGWQGIEYKLNTVGSSRGDYPFVTVTLGLGTSMFEKMISISLLEVHKNGQGKDVYKRQDDLLAKDSMFADYKAVKEGNVWTTEKSMYQATDKIAPVSYTHLAERVISGHLSASRSMTIVSAPNNPI